MSNKQSLSFEKCITLLFFTFSNILFTFASQVLFWGGGGGGGSGIFSTYKIYAVFDQFCNTGKNYEVAIT